MSLLRFAATAVAAFCLSATPAFAGGGKSDVCHPAGKSGNVLTLNVSNNAVSAHLGHGDWLPMEFWVDADGDGYGDPDDAVEACVQPADAVDNADDCDDGDDTVNPDGVEVCDDGLDNDCVGGDEPCLVAETWNAADDFDSLNPNGEWSYGYTNGLGGFTQFTSYGASGLLEWWNRGYFWLQVYANRTGSTYGNCGDWCLLPGTLAMHPDNSALKAVTRFTAPADGDYDVDGGFRPIDHQSSSIEVWVLHNGAVVAHGYLGAWWTTFDFDETLGLLAGDTVDFVVGRGGGNYYNDGTDLDATIYGPY